MTILVNISYYSSALNANMFDFLFDVVSIILSISLIYLYYFSGFMTTMSSLDTDVSAVTDGGLTAAAGGGSAVATVAAGGAGGAPGGGPAGGPGSISVLWSEVATTVSSLIAW